MLTADRLIGGIVLLKAVDVTVRGPSGATGLWAIAAGVLAVGGALLIADRPRAGWLVALAGCAAIVVEQPLELRLQHTVLLAWAALGAYVARGEAERLLLWRVLVSTLYGVAALAKVNESYLSGDALALALSGAPFGTGLVPLPPPALLVSLAVALVAVEILLAAIPWVSRLAGPGFACAVVFHLLAVPLAGVEPLVALRLVVFGGTSLVLLAACTGRLPVGVRTATQEEDSVGGQRPSRW